MSQKENPHDRPELAQLRAELAAVRRELDRHDRAWHREMQIAERVHRSLLPRPVRHSRIDLAPRHVAVNQVGGDYCQVLFPTDSSCYLTVCDVTGHGFGAALLATRVSSEVRRLVSEQRHPREIVGTLNAFVLDNFAETELQLSFFAVRIDFKRDKFAYSGAGHPGQLLIRAGSGRADVLHSQNLLIGVAPSRLADTQENEQEYHRGDRLLLFTDGLTETVGADGAMLGTGGLAQMATTICAGDSSDTADCILERLASFRSSKPRDDMTLIVAELT